MTQQYKKGGGETHSYLKASAGRHTLLPLLQQPFQHSRKKVKKKIKQRSICASLHNCCTKLKPIVAQGTYHLSGRHDGADKDAYWYHEYGEVFTWWIPEPETEQHIGKDVHVHFDLPIFKYFNMLWYTVIVIQYTKVNTKKLKRIAISVDEARHVYECVDIPGSPADLLPPFIKMSKTDGLHIKKHYTH